MVAEADESDRSFLKLSPTLAVVTNIDREHLDAYRDLADIQDAFVGFVNKVPFYGAAVLCLDDAPVQDILPRVERRVDHLRPLAAGAASRRATCSSARGLELHRQSRAARPSGTITLAVPGAHNVLNSLAAVAVGLDLGVALRRGPRRPRVVHRRRPALPGARRGRRASW